MAATLFASACTSAGPATDGACAWVAPILVSRADVLTDRTAAAILTHNEAWEAVCGPLERP